MYPLRILKGYTKIVDNPYRFGCYVDGTGIIYFDIICNVKDQEWNPEKIPICSAHMGRFCVSILGNYDILSGRYQRNESDYLCHGDHDSI